MPMVRIYPISIKQGVGAQTPIKARHLRYGGWLMDAEPTHDDRTVASFEYKEGGSGSLDKTEGAR